MRPHGGQSKHFSTQPSILIIPQKRVLAVRVGMVDLKQVTLFQTGCSTSYENTNVDVARQGRRRNRGRE